MPLDRFWWWYFSRRLRRMEDWIMTLFDDVQAKLTALETVQAEQAADIQAAIDLIHELQAQIGTPTDGLTQVEAQAVLDRLNTLEGAMQATAARYPEAPPV